MPKISKQKMAQRRAEIKKYLSEFIKKRKLDFSFDYIEEVIYEEKNKNSFNQFVAMFFRGFSEEDFKKYGNRLLEVVNDAWNYFPHKILGGLSPAEKIEGGKVSDSIEENEPAERQREELWGEDGPYSEVKLITETRILDDRVSRVFLVVETVVNPFTYKFCLKNKKHFKDDEIILQLLEHSENRGFKDGFVSMAFHEEIEGKETFDRAEYHRQYAQEAVIRMHKFVMKKLGIDESPAFVMNVK